MNDSEEIGNIECARAAVYLAPREDSRLWTTAAVWLGRDTAAGVSRQRPRLDWISDEEAAAITAEPRRYGFHGTLKAPFALASGKTLAALDSTLSAFAKTRKSFRVPLKVDVLEGFIALRPQDEAAALAALADACVETFDPFRAPSPPEDLARRRKAALTPRQDELLIRWGYPYVFETFRFHMTLTGRLDTARRNAVRTGLEALFDPALSEPIAFDSICLFCQPSRDAPFRLIRRHVFGDAL